MSTDNRDVVERVREIIPTATLTTIQFLEVSAARTDEPPFISSGGVPVQLEIAFQLVENTANYKLRVAIERPDVSCAVAVGVQYTVADPTPWNDPDIIICFGQKVALAAAYPFARAKISGITGDMGIPPVLLGMFIPDPAGDEVAEPPASRS